MAGNKEIKQKITLDGEKQYNQALKEAQRNLRTLKSELKAETAELGKNASEQQKAEAKSKSLKKQIQEQEKVVSTLKAALAEVKEKYGDNADEVAKWEQKLNGARTTLANMKSDLEGVGGGFKTVNTDAAAATVATKSVADALGSIGSAGDSVSSALEGIFTGLIDRVTDAAEALWGLITDTAAKANNWTDLASYYGTSAQEIQKWANSIEAAGGDFEKFQGIINKLAFGGKEKKVTELLGVSKENYKDDLSYTLAALDALDRRRKLLGQGWFDDTMSELFGAKKSTDVAWFLNNDRGHTDANGNWVYGWRDNPDRFNGDKSGYGMSTEELSTMNDVYVRLEEIETKWAALKRNFAAGFGVAALDLMVNVSGTLDGIADYMNAKDEQGRTDALKKIRANVEEFFRKLGEIIRDCIHIIKDVGLELKESDDPLTAAIGDILVKLADSLQWMIDNQDKVKAAFEAIFGVWLLAKLAAVAGKLGSILMQIETIKAFKGLGTGAGAAGAGTGAGTGAGAGSAAGAGGAGGGGLMASAFASVKSFFAANGLSAFIPAGVLAAVLYAGDKAQKGTEQEIENRREERLEAAKKLSGTDAWFLEESANARGLLRDENGELVKDWTGRYGTIGMNWEKERELLMGLGDRSDLQKMQLHNLLSGYGAMGDDAWGQLLKLWETGGNDEYFTDARYDALLEAITQAYTDWANDPNRIPEGSLLPEDWYTTTTAGQGAGVANENGVTSKDLEGLQNIPGGVESAAEKGVKKGISGLRVEIDGQAAGRILAPYVSQEIARSLE